MSNTASPALTSARSELAALRSAARVLVELVDENVEDLDPVEVAALDRLRLLIDPED